MNQSLEDNQSNDSSRIRPNSSLSASELDASDTRLHGRRIETRQGWDKSSLQILETRLGRFGGRSDIPGGHASADRSGGEMWPFCARESSDLSSVGTSSGTWENILPPSSSRGRGFRGRFAALPTVKGVPELLKGDRKQSETLRAKLDCPSACRMGTSGHRILHCLVHVEQDGRGREQEDVNVSTLITRSKFALAETRQDAC